MKVEVLVEIIRKRARQAVREVNDRSTYRIAAVLVDLADDIEAAKDQLEGNL